MSKLKMLARSLGLAAVLSVVGLAAGVGAASAVTGTFSTTGEVRLSGDLTVSLEGGPSVECPEFEAIARVSGTAFWVIQGGAPPLSTSPNGACDGGTELGLAMIGGVDWDGSTWTLSNSGVNGFPQDSPFGGYWSYGFSGEWINAAGGEPSRIVLSDAVLGYDSNEDETVASGVLEVTTLAGGDVTVAE